MNIEKNIDKIREEFPLLDQWVFFNAADYNIPGEYWVKAMKDSIDYQRRGQMSDNPPFGFATHPFLTKEFFECKERAADLLHAKPKEVTNMYRIMTASNLIINEFFDWEEGDNIVFTDLEYPSIPYIFLNLRDKYGVELRRIENVDGEILMSDLEDAIDEDTKLVSINRTTCWCGFTYDVEKVCKLAHEYNAYVYDDAIQSVGAIDVNVHKDDVDFLTTGSYKWQCGPEGAGIFYIKEDLIEEFDPDFRNYLWADYGNEIPFSKPDHDNIKHWDYPLVNDANRFEQGIVTSPTLFGWNATLKFYEKLGIKNIEKRITELGGYLIERLQDIGCEILTPINEDKRHGLIKYTTGSYEKDKKSSEFFNSPPVGKKPIKVSLRSLGGVDGMRVSCHFYNTKDELDELVERQKKLM